MLKSQIITNDMEMRALSDDELEAVNGGPGPIIAVAATVLLVGLMVYFMTQRR